MHAMFNCVRHGDSVCEKARLGEKEKHTHADKRGRNTHIYFHTLTKQMCILYASVSRCRTFDIYMQNVIRFIVVFCLTTAYVVFTTLNSHSYSPDIRRY